MSDDILTITRVPALEYHLISKSLDAGVKGIMCPKIETKQQAETLLLSISRNLFNGQKYVIFNLWIKKEPMVLTDIVGLGKIGKEFVRKVEVFSMDINYFGPRKKNVKYKYFNNLKKMAKYIDYLVITCTGGEKTKKLIN